MASLTFTPEQMKQVITSIEQTKGKRLTNNLEKVQRKLESDSVSVDDILKILKMKGKKSNGLKQPPNSWRLYLAKTGQSLKDPKAKETWANMTEDEKKPYVDEATKLREEYKIQKEQMSDESDIKSEVETDDKSEILAKSESDESDEDDQKAKSYYKIIDGKKYDRKLLERADSLSKDDKDINLKSAKLIWQDAEDGNQVTDCERETVKYILDNYKCNRGAKQYLKEKL